MNFLKSLLSWFKKAEVSVLRDPEEDKLRVGSYQESVKPDGEIQAGVKITLPWPEKK